MKLSRVGRIEKLTNRKYPHAFFDAAKGRIMSTNGGAIVIVECEAEPGDTSGFISMEALEEYREWCKHANPKFISFEANDKEIVIRNAVTGRHLHMPRPHAHRFPAFEKLIPKIPNGTPPSATFDPLLLKAVVDSFPTDEIGSDVRSISLWLLPEHAGDKPTETPVPPILIRAHHEGGLAMMMGTRYCIKRELWNTKLPGIPREEKEEEHERGKGTETGSALETGRSQQSR